MQHCDFAVAPVCLDFGHAIAGFPERIRHFPVVMRDRDRDALESDRQPFLDHHSDHVSGREAERIAERRQDIGFAAERLRYGEKEDGRLICLIVIC